VEAQAKLGQGGFDMPDMRTGLDGLSSYRSTLGVTFDGSQDGSPLQWSAQYALIQRAEPAGRALTVEKSENIRDEDPSFVAELGGVSYRASSGEACTATLLTEQPFPLTDMQPAGMLAGLLGAEAAGNETVNGMDAARYTFDERAIGQNGKNRSSGEVWVASQGGYAVRYRLTTKGDEAFFGKGTQGTLTWEYELTDINQPLAIDLPADCPGGLIDAPRLADAGNVEDAPGILQYESSSSPGEAAAFYQKELASLGWEAPSAPALPPGVSAEEYQRALAALQAMGLGQPGQPAQPTATANPDEAFLLFRRGNEVLRVVITRQDSATQVVLTVSRKPASPQ
jgi:hypothetical protein